MHGREPERSERRGRITRAQHTQQHKLSKDEAWVVERKSRVLLLCLAGSITGHIRADKIGRLVLRVIGQFIEADSSCIIRSSLEIACAEDTTLRRLRLVGSITFYITQPGT